MIDYSLLLLFPAAMAFAAAMDLLTMTIPNRVSLLLVGAFFIAAYFAGLPPQKVLEHVGTGLMVLAVCFVLFALGTFGGGDAKLLAASSLWIGFDDIGVYVFGIALAGGGLAILALVGRKHFPEGSFNAPRWFLRLQEDKSKMPYGLAISAAALWVYPQTAFFHGLAH